MLYDSLKMLDDSDVYPMHMPGHKRNKNFMPPGLPCDIDITEIYGFDDLHNPQGLLLETSKLAAELYGSREAFMLINGTTAGILAAIGAHTERGDKILATDNCHVAIPNAAMLFGLELEYITSRIDENSGIPCSVSPFAIEAALKQNTDIKLVVITSPTYEGVVSDIASIAPVVHNFGALLLVDSAHGAHLGFSDAFPQSAVSLGSDIVVVSLHKTLPALTQCSLLHACSERTDIAKLKRMLSVLQTSSPSYLLMASIDHCLRLLKSEKEKLFLNYKGNLSAFYANTKNLENLFVFHIRPDTQSDAFFNHDPGKIVVITKKAAISGLFLADTLRAKYKIEVERVCGNYIIALTSICDSQAGFFRLADALHEIDTGL